MRVLLSLVLVVLALLVLVGCAQQPAVQDPYASDDVLPEEAAEESPYVPTEDNEVIIDLIEEDVPDLGDMI